MVVSGWASEMGELEALRSGTELARCRFCRVLFVGQNKSQVELPGKARGAQLNLNFR